VFQVEEGELILDAMLKDALPDVANPTVESVWRVFKEFCLMPADCQSDMFLFECGVFDYTGTEMFHFSFVRQFGVYESDEDDDGEYDHIEQLHCEFLFEPTEELRKWNISLWADEEAPLEDWFAEVESLPIFRILRHRRADEFRVDQWEV